MAALTAVLLDTCGAPPSVAPPATPSVVGEPSNAPSAAPRYGASLVIANRLGRAVGMTGMSFGSPLSPGSLILSALYRITPTLDVVPDLTDGPCEPEEEGLVIRCRLIAAVFDDGSPLTADDVAYSYRLRQQPSCREVVFPCLAGFETAPSLRDIRVIESRTIDFVLTHPDPTFLTTMLPNIPIEPRHVIEAAFARFLADTRGLTSAELTVTADAIDQELQRDPPVCTTRIEALRALFVRLHVPSYREDYGPGPDYDRCAFTAAGGLMIRQLIAGLSTSGMDAVQAAYPLLSSNWDPVGTGPYRFVSATADGIELEASPTYHGGSASTRGVRLVPTGGMGTEILAGKVDIDPLEDIDVGGEHPDVGLLRIHTPQPAYIALHYNLRPGHLFADRNLRLAMQLCVDMPRVIDAVTGDRSNAIVSPLMPGGWATDADLTVPAQDVAKAESLIQDSGWVRGPGGTYRKAGRRLAAEIVVRGDIAERSKAADLIAAQARTCGMDIASHPVRYSEDILAMIGAYPHDIPGTKRPYDLYLGGMSNAPDPGGATAPFDSRLITDSAHPNGNDADMIGFADPTVDRLIDAGLATYDPVERTRTYRALQEEFAAQQPMLFLWNPPQFGAIRATVSTTGAPLDLTAPGWFWQPEKLVIRIDGP